VSDAGATHQSGGAPSSAPRGEPPRDPACLFCRIVAGEIPSDKLHDDDLVLAIRDIAPRAPSHILLMPKRHIASAAELTEDDGPMLGRLFAVAADLARSGGLTEGGYRLVSNVGRWGGQTVDHLHVHLMGGRAFDWPPG
jgi:diadenosine tetraphosphate (Ap4A) HIT family hydrolase